MGKCWHGLAFEESKNDPQQEIWEKVGGTIMIVEKEDKALETKEYLDFLEQIIACHAGHTVICNDKIHFHFLQNHKTPKKFRNPGERKKTKKAQE